MPASAMDEPAYWVWAGLSKKDVPNDASIYLYQGNFKNGNFERKGIFPSPFGTRPVTIVYRLYAPLPEPEKIIAAHSILKRKWQEQGVKIDGLQLDFDSPTAKLSDYAAFLKNVRQKMDKEDRLSTTGLGDWVANGSKESLDQLNGTVDEIVFQLYQGHKPLPQIRLYTDRLKNNSGDYKIGLLHSQNAATILTTLKGNPNFHGIVYFLQK